MNQETQSFLFLLTSTLKNDNNNIVNFLPLLIMLIPLIQKIVQFEKIFKYLSNLFNRHDKYFEYNIQSHDVPVIRNYTSVPMMRIQFSNKFLAVNHYINKNLKNLLLSLFILIIFLTQYYKT